MTVWLRNTEGSYWPPACLRFLGAKWNKVNEKFISIAIDYGNKLHLNSDKGGSFNTHLGIGDSTSNDAYPNTFLNRPQFVAYDVDKDATKSVDYN